MSKAGEVKVGDTAGIKREDVYIPLSNKACKSLMRSIEENISSVKKLIGMVERDYPELEELRTKFLISDCNSAYNIQKFRKVASDINGEVAWCQEEIEQKIEGIKTSLGKVYEALSNHNAILAASGYKATISEAEKLSAKMDAELPIKCGAVYLLYGQIKSFLKQQKKEMSGEDVKKSKGAEVVKYVPKHIREVSDEVLKEQERRAQEAEDELLASLSEPDRLPEAPNAASIPNPKQSRNVKKDLASAKPKVAAAANKFSNTTAQDYATVSAEMRPDADTSEGSWSMKKSGRTVVVVKTEGIDIPPTLGSTNTKSGSGAKAESLPTPPLPPAPPPPTMNAEKHEVKKQAYQSPSPSSAGHAKAKIKVASKAKVAKSVEVVSAPVNSIDNDEMTIDLSKFLPPVIKDDEESMYEANVKINSGLGGVKLVIIYDKSDTSDQLMTTEVQSNSDESFETMTEFDSAPSSVPFSTPLVTSSAGSEAGDMSGDHEEPPVLVVPSLNLSASATVFEPVSYKANKSSHSIAPAYVRPVNQFPNVFVAPLPNHYHLPKGMWSFRTTIPSDSVSAQDTWSLRTPIPNGQPTFGIIAEGVFGSLVMPMAQPSFPSGFAIDQSHHDRSTCLGTVPDPDYNATTPSDTF